MNKTQCNRCGECCLTSPCQIPVVHMDGLRYILVNEFGKPKEINGLDIVEVLFSYQEDLLPSGQIHGFFEPLPNRGNKCMWLKKEGAYYTCTLFWNKTSEILVGLAEQIVGKDKGCTLSNPTFVPTLPMVLRNHNRGLASMEVKK